MADIVVTADNVVKYAGARTGTGTAAAAVTAGQTVYKASADSLLYLADCSTAAKADAVGVALNGAAIGQPIMYAASGGLNPGGTVVVGTVYAVTDTAGGIGDVAERAAEDYITILGVGTTSSRIELDIAASGVAIPGA